MKKEVEFEGKKYIIRKPDANVLQKADMHASLAFTKALEEGLKTQSYIDSVTQTKSSDEADKKAKQEMNVLLKKLARGGYSKMEARADAIKVYRLRMELLGKLSSRRNRYSADAIAEKAANEYIMANTCFDEDGKKVFSSVEDYANRKDTPLVEFLRDEATFGENPVDSLEEVQFLKKYGFMNDDYELVNSEGKVVDEDYNVVENESEFTEFTD